MLGKTGITLLFSTHVDIARFQNKIELNVNELLNSIDKYDGYSLTRGVCGLALLISYLQEKSRIEDDASVLLNEVDEIVLHGLKSDISIHFFDYLHGYLGIINYLIRRKHQIINDDFILQSILKLLTFLEEDSKYPFDYSVQDTKYVANFGLAHGIPSFLSMLININKIIKSTDVDNYIRRLTLFIFSKKQHLPHIKSKYPHCLPKEDMPYLEGRLAWCYGDLGINITLLKSARYLKDELLEKEILQDLIYCANRKSFKDTAIMDCCFCHGAAGVSYIYKQLYRIYKINEFHENYSFWQDFIQDRYNEYGLDGLKTYYGKEGWVLEKGLLEGIAGVYISLYPDEVDQDLINYLFLIDF